MISAAGVRRPAGAIDRRRGAFLGVGASAIDGSCLISKVHEGSPAEKAGLELDDVIVAFAGDKITNFDTLTARIARCVPEEQVEVQVLRQAIDDGGNTGTGGAQTASTTVTLAVSAVNDAPTAAAPASIAVGANVPTALTGLAEWLTIRRGTELWKTATAHLAAMVSATVLFLLAAIVGHGGYADGEVTTGGLVLTVVGYGTMALGGWVGGSIVFVHGMRVLKLVDDPVERAVSPAPQPEREAASGRGT